MNSFYLSINDGRRLWVKILNAGGSIFSTLCCGHCLVFHYSPYKVSTCMCIYIMWPSRTRSKGCIKCSSGHCCQHRKQQQHFTPNFCSNFPKLQSILSKDFNPTLQPNRKKGPCEHLRGMTPAYIRLFCQIQTYHSIRLRLKLRYWRCICMSLTMAKS